MVRARNIKPGFFSNDDLAECEALARLLFAGLWTIADREGRLEDKHRKIKVMVLPMMKRIVKSYYPSYTVKILSLGIQLMGMTTSKLIIGRNLKILIVKSHPVKSLNGLLNLLIIKRYQKSTILIQCNNLKST
ncbi:hypothetical protein ARAF_0496 [Arsenophonus endosymbiont of Aleurodicus floccissimus]|uniref:hypothetical protein n=1 Tax=Arsenophonus endosymbiont of Aleurodicus floccissimus TaxID=2152761 RepID=UPI000EC74F09|nr:hypothetical protein [Arsenophonus endosymbiont of Aleurodicus floccissimus]SPP31372.1 hypothetical protein ARAF_0496 [Arsenophonus endosymbiont of Aleurodicus floccissimus]